MTACASENSCEFSRTFPEPLFVRSRTVVSRIVAGETLVVPIRGKVGDLASIYSFNGTGTLIWQSLDSPKPVSDLFNAVQREYDVSPQQAEEDVTRFIEDMLAVGLVEISSSAAVSASQKCEPEAEQENCSAGQGANPVQMATPQAI